MQQPAPHIAPLRPLDATAWTPYGWLPVRDTDPADGVHTLSFEWADPHVNIISHALEEIERDDGAPVCDRLFRHLTHTQALLVLDADCVIAVAPAQAAFRTPSDLCHIEAFELHRGDGLVLHPGTWHWGPFPLASPRVDLYNIQGRRYLDDNDCQVLRHLGSVVCRQASG